MAERRGVEYEQVGSDYMEKRQLRSGRRRLGAAGRARRRLRHLGRLRGLELRPRRGRLGRPADRHDPDGDHVHVHGLRRSPSCRRRSRRRAAATASRRRALGPWGGFLTGTAILIEYAIAPAAIVMLHRRLRRVARHLRDHRRLAGLPRLLRRLRRHPPVRRRRGAEGHVRHHRDRGRRPARRSSFGDDPRASTPRT